MDFFQWKEENRAFAPIAMWLWNGAFSPRTIDDAMRDLREQGVGRVMICPACGMVAPWDSNGFAEALRAAARSAARYDVNVWLCGYDTGEVASVAVYRAQELTADGIRTIEPPQRTRYDRAAVAAFIEAVYARYRTVCARFWGYEIGGIVSMEQAEDYLPYSAAIAERALRAGGSVAPDAHYRKAAARVLRETWLRETEEWCHESEVVHCAFDSQAELPMARNASLSEIKRVASAAEQFGKEMALGFCATPRDIALGITQSVYRVPLSRLGERKRDSVADEVPRALTTRLCRMMRDLRRVCDVLIVGEAPSEMLEALCAHHVDFHLADEETMQGATRTGSTLVVGNCAYHTILLPPMETIAASTARLLNGFSGTVLSLAPFPAHTSEGEDAPTFAARRCASVSALMDALDALYPERPRALDQNGAPLSTVLAVQLRAEDETDVYYYVNCGAEQSVCLDLHDGRSCALFDAATGELYDVETEAGRLSMTLCEGGCAVLLCSPTPIGAGQECGILHSGAWLKTYPRAEELTAHVQPCEANIHRLTAGDVTLGGKEFRAASLDALRGAFYALEEGTPFAVSYPFSVYSVPEGPFYAEIEAAENLTRITLNGKAIGADGDLRAFVRVGTNVLRIEGKKYNCYRAPQESAPAEDYPSYRETELEAVVLHGRFLVLNDKLCAWKDLAPGDVTVQGLGDYRAPLSYRIPLPERELRGKLLLVEGAFSAAELTIGRRTVRMEQPPFAAELFEFECGKTATLTLTRAEGDGAFGLSAVKLLDT